MKPDEKREKKDARWVAAPAALTAAAVPERCKAIIPVVYDNLDVRAQMRQQSIYFGDLNDAVSDYKELDIAKYGEVPIGRKILDIIDQIHGDKFRTSLVRCWKCITKK